MTAFTDPLAERATIAALLRQDSADDARKAIHANGIAGALFADPATREVFGVIEQCIATGGCPDYALIVPLVTVATDVEIESWLKDQVSAANLPYYVARLKTCRRERETQAARDRLTKAIAAGATPGELTAIVEAIKEAGAGEPASKLRFCDTSKLRDAELPPPRFTIQTLLPRDQVTLFGGHGGSGKTMVGYVLCAHVATGTDWAGLRVLPGKVLAVSFEDPEELMLWRFRNIAEEYGLDMDKVIRNVKMIDATEAQPIMREVSERGVKDAQPTPDGLSLMEMIVGEKLDLVQIDNASDAFDGDENNRRQVRKFVRYLASGIRVHHGALLLLAHIDKAAARYGAAGNSYSGSTAWHNSVRSRLAMIDSQLRQEKLNVGKRLETAIKLRFSSRGVPVLDDGAGDHDEREQQERADDEALLACFIAAQEAGATVPTGERGSNTTRQALSVYPECPQELRKNGVRFQEGIARLARAGKIVRETYRDHRRHEAVRYILTARVCASFKSGAEVAQPPQDPIIPMRDFCIGGMGELARAQTAQVSKVAHPPKGNGGDTPQPGQVWADGKGWVWEPAP